MSKNIDQLLGDIDNYLQINQDSASVDIEKAALEHKEKKLRELKGNSYQLKALFFAGVALMGLDPRIETFINVSILAFATIIMLWLHSKAKKEMNQIDVAQSFNDFFEQKKKVATGLLNLYQKIRIVMYGILIIITGFNIYFYSQSPDLLSFAIYLAGILIGGFLIVRNMESVVREYKHITQN